MQQLRLHYLSCFALPFIVHKINPRIFEATDLDEEEIYPADDESFLLDNLNFFFDLPVQLSGFLKVLWDLIFESSYSRFLQLASATPEQLPADNLPPLRPKALPRLRRLTRFSHRRRCRRRRRYLATVAGSRAGEN